MAKIQSNPQKAAVITDGEKTNKKLDASGETFFEVGLLRNYTECCTDTPPQQTVYVEVCIKAP